MTQKLLYIELDKIIDNVEMLRTVDRRTPKYAAMLGSVKQDGIITPISVIPNPDDSAPNTFVLVDGKHRLTAARDCGLQAIPAHVLGIEQRNVLETQIIANSQKVETRPVEYSRALVKILAANPTLTRAKLAAKLSHDEQWINERLGLLRLIPEAQTLVDDGKIGLSNAYSLAKLPPEEQANFIEQAMTEQASAFSITVVQQIRALALAKRQGRKEEGPKPFEPVATIRQKRDIISVIDEASEDAIFSIMSENDVKKDQPTAIFLLALKWAVHLDKESVDEQVAKDAARKAEAKLRQEAAKQERITIARRVREELEARKKEAEKADVPVSA